MKWLVVLLVSLAVTASYPTEVKTWTLMQLSKGIETSSHPDLAPYLEEALNRIMYQYFTGNETSVYAAVLSPSGKDSWTVEELDKVIKEQLSHPYWANIRAARFLLDEAVQRGFNQNIVPVGVPALDVSLWTHEDIEEALKSDQTNAELVMLLKKARQDLEKLDNETTKKKTVGLVTRVGLVHHKGIPEFLPMPKDSLYTWAQKNMMPTF